MGEIDMRVILKGMVILGIAIQTCSGCLIMEDTSTDETFGCTIKLDFSQKTREFIEDCNSTEESTACSQYDLSTFTNYQESDLVPASKFLINQEKEKTTFTFDGIEQLKKFLKALREVVGAYWGKYENIYNSYEFCGFGKWVDLEHYLFEIDSIIQLLPAD